MIRSVELERIEFVRRSFESRSERWDVASRQIPKRTSIVEENRPESLTVSSISMELVEEINRLVLMKRKENDLPLCRTEQIPWTRRFPGDFGVVASFCFLFSLTRWKDQCQRIVSRPRKRKGLLVDRWVESSSRAVLSRSLWSFELTVSRRRVEAAFARWTEEKSWVLLGRDFSISVRLLLMRSEKR